MALAPDLPAYRGRPPAVPATMQRLLSPAVPPGPSQPAVAAHAYDAVPSAGRKSLQVGRGGLKLPRSEPLASFLGRYRVGAGEPTDVVAGWLRDLGHHAVRTWAGGLGVQTFVGTLGRMSLPR